MKIEEYLSTLPQSILSGEEIQIPPDTIREICKFADLGQNDTFYHLGSGNGTSLKIARQEFNVKNAIGIDNSEKMISLAKKMIDEENRRGLGASAPDSNAWRKMSKITRHC